MFLKWRVLCFKKTSKKIVLGNKKNSTCLKIVDECANSVEIYLKFLPTINLLDYVDRKVEKSIKIIDKNVMLKHSLE
jgi:hypothetical protein